MSRTELVPGILIAGLATLVVSLAVCVPRVVVDAGLDSQTSVRPLHLFAALVVFVGFACGSRLGTALVLATTIGLSSIILAGIWGTGASSGAYIGGLVPFSDARTYLHCGRLVAEGGTFEHLMICSRRPLFTALLAGLLRMTGENLRAVNALLMIATNASCVVACWSLRRQYGPLAGTVALLVLCLFYRPFIGTLLTEHLGLALGALGFAVLLEGADLRRPSLFLFGCLATSLALSARAGAFFVLPMLALWGGRYFRRESFVSVGVLVSAIGVMVLGVGSSVWMSATLGRADGAFSNFSYVLYGLLAGGDWRSALQDHPELLSIDRGEHPRMIYGLALDLLRSDPWRLWRGAGRAWAAFLGPYPFSFVERRSAAWLLVGMATVGFARAALRRSAGESLTLAMALGVFLSVPFVPPWDASSMRTYAATLPVLAALPALGVATTRKSERGDERARFGGPRVPAALVIAIAGACLLSPLLCWAVGSPIRYRPRAPACEATVFVRVTSGSFVDVLDDHAAEDVPFAVAVTQFRAGLQVLRRPSLERELTGLQPPFRLVSAPGNGPDGLGEFLLASAPNTVPADGAVRTFCAALSSGGYNLAYPLSNAGTLDGAGD